MQKYKKIFEEDCDTTRGRKRLSIRINRVGENLKMRMKIRAAWQGSLFPRLVSSRERVI